MPFTPDQIRQKAYELEAKGAPDSDIEEFVRLATQEAGIQPVQPPKPKGFLRKTAEAIVKPFAKTGVQALNLGESVVDLARGDVKGANQALSKERRVPFLGKTAPVITGDENFGGLVKKTIGTGLELGSSVVGGGGTGQVVKSGLKGLVKQGVKQGAKAGFLSGSSAGTGEALSNEESMGSSLKQGLKSGLVGGAVGGAVGGVLGGAGSKVKGSFLKAKTQSFDDTLEIIKPELNKAEKISALEQGRGIKGKLGTIEIAPSKRDIDVAKATEGIVDKKKDFIENIVAVKGVIKKEAEDTISHLKKNDVIFNTSQLNKKLSEIEKSPLLVSDTKLNNSYDLARQKFVELVNSKPKKLSGLLEARKEFDVWIEKNFPKIFDDPNNAPFQVALRDIRSAANDFIAEKLPNGSPFKESLKKQSLLYEAVDNIATKSYRDVGTNSIQRFLKKNPITKDVVKIGIGATAGGLGIKYLD